MTTAATKPGQVKKAAGIWGLLFWLFIVLLVAVPEVAAAFIPLAIIGVVIFFLARSNKKSPAPTRRSREGSTRSSGEAMHSGAVATQASVPESAPYYPPLADTGENFDFQRSGADARARIDAVRRDDDNIYEIDVTVRPRGGREYRTTLVTAVPTDRLDELVRGRSLGVRVDPTRPGGPIFVM